MYQGRRQWNGEQRCHTPRTKCLQSEICWCFGPHRQEHWHLQGMLDKLCTDRERHGMSIYEIKAKSLTLRRTLSEYWTNFQHRWQSHRECTNSHIPRQQDNLGQSLFRMQQEKKLLPSTAVYASFRKIPGMEWQKHKHRGQDATTGDVCFLFYHMLQKLGQ